MSLPIFEREIQKMSRRVDKNAVGPVSEKVLRLFFESPSIFLKNRDPPRFGRDEQEFFSAVEAQNIRTGSDGKPSGHPASREIHDQKAGIPLAGDKSLLPTGVDQKPVGMEAGKGDSSIDPEGRGIDPHQKVPGLDGRIDSFRKRIVAGVPHLPS